MINNMKATLEYNEVIKIDYQLYTEVANLFLDELKKICEKYNVEMYVDNTNININLSDLIKIEKIMRSGEIDN